MVAINKTISDAQVVQALRGAARETGADFDYLLRTAQRESSLEPTAKAKTSSAAGLFQFIEQTWFDMVKKHGAEAGLGRFADKIEADSKGRHKVPDETLRQEILALRMDPKASSFMAGKLTQESESHLEASLNRAVNTGELYIAHFLGAGGAARFIEAAEDTPQGSAAEAFPKAAEANRAIFYEKNGRARTLGEVYAVLTKSHIDPPADLAQKETAPKATETAPPANPWLDQLRPTLHDLPFEAEVPRTSYQAVKAPDFLEYARAHAVPQQLAGQGFVSKLGLSPVLLDVLAALQGHSGKEEASEVKGGCS